MVAVSNPAMHQHSHWHQRNTCMELLTLASCHAPGGIFHSLSRVTNGIDANLVRVLGVLCCVLAGQPQMLNGSGKTCLQQNSKQQICLAAWWRQLR